MLELLSVILIILILDALVTATEAALLSVSPSRVEAAKTAGTRGAAALDRLKADIQHPLGTLIILSNIITIMGAFVVGVLASARYGDVITGIVSAVFTFLVIVFAEIVPKVLGERYADSVALAAAPGLNAIMHLFSPVINFSGLIARSFTRGVRKSSSSEEEIKAMASLGVREGSIQKEEASLIQRAFRLNDITARDLMTPRKRVFYFDGSKTLAELKDKIVTAPKSRIPVTADEHLREVLGVAYQRDLLIGLEQGRDQEKISAFAKKTVFVPATMHADHLLHEFQKTRMHLGIVVNEHGEVSGVVTLEDCLEELVGEIIDEKDVEPELIKRLSKDEILVHGETRGRYVNSFFQTSLPDTKTITGFLLSHFNRIPEKGEVTYWKGLKFVVEEAAGGDIQRVRIIRLTSAFNGDTMNIDE